ncbi:FMN-binding protein [Sediminispirochaeta smaragdinae]|uniref:FMN-binding domain protein n=1 Tax=Sediminispirochaeta smaragdinae (strain DSM 11293 / JCM 15392 / SEBR 4228) TaxID=573413 RepID=E1RBL0_SEDSS|nr:FMN-binding protein [Sediminispirochaeta smaragdinae]ADK79740.1 FMN-binding domain protein [Sediminispirochaeta smaragdinae DSM 11293]
MKKEGTFALRIYPVLFMALLTVLFITVVSGIYLSTKDLVEMNETLSRKKAVLYAAGIDFPDGNSEKIQEIYTNRVREIGTIDGRPAYFEILTDGSVSGYAAYVSGAGLWGQIVAIFGFGKDLKQFTGVEFIEQNETPGLGARITEPWFKEQFRGKSGPFTLVGEGTATGPGQLDAITGATRTSTAILRISNKAPEVAEEVIASNGGEH